MSCLSLARDLQFQLEGIARGSQLRRSHLDLAVTSKEGKQPAILFDNANVKQFISAEWCTSVNKTHSTITSQEASSAIR